jgi:hypothetical protein
MNEQEILNRVREAIACLDEAANHLPIDNRFQRKLHTRIQDAGDRLVEVREELQIEVEAAEKLRRVLERKTTT